MEIQRSSGRSMFDNLSIVSVIMRDCPLWRTASFVILLKLIFQTNSNPGKDEGNDADKSVSCKKGGIDSGHVFFGDNRIFIKKK
jgi:hypothetical protein